MHNSDLFLLLIFALGSYIQTTTGFAFGLIVMSGVTALGLAPIEVTAFAISLLSLVNSGIGLQGKLWRQINWLALRWFMVACLPAIFAGLWLLDYLGENALHLLQLILGISIVISSLLMVVKVKTRQSSPGYSFAISGALAGVMGGMFATFGPPISYLMYRQPDTLSRIRATLLAIFAVTAVVRLLLVVNTTGIHSGTWLICALGVPVVMLSTVLAKRFPPPLSQDAARHLAFGLLMLSGISLTSQGLLGG